MCINQFNKPSFPRRREFSRFYIKLDSRLRGNDETALSPFNLYPSRQRGASIVELVMFIIIISVAVVGVLLVMNLTTAHSADPLVRKQALAIAESLLEEIELMPFTYCDPDDANAASAVNATVGPGGCANWPEDVTVGPSPGGESRGGALSVPAGSNPFDNVADYGGYSMNGITDITGGAATGLGNYSANVTLARAGSAFLGVADNGAALQITVTVNAPDGTTQVVLDGYRTRYSPNNLP